MEVQPSNSDPTFDTLTSDTTAVWTQEPRRAPFVNYTTFILRTLAEESYTAHSTISDTACIY